MAVSQIDVQRIMLGFLVEGHKYPNFFSAQGDIPPVRIPMTS